MPSAVLPYSGFQLGKETVAKGTVVNPTRELYPDPSGYFDPGLAIAFHEGAQRGLSTNITHATLTGRAPTVGFRTESSHGITYDDLTIIGSQLSGAQAGATGPTAWTWTFDFAETAPTYDTFTLQVFDASQCYEIPYGFMTGFTISAGNDDLTQASMDWVGQSANKVTVDAVAANNAVKIPSGLWTVEYASTYAGLDGSPLLSNIMRSWELSVQLPQFPRRYATGSLNFGQGVGSRNLSGTLSMVWDSSASAVAQYDLFAAQTTSFIRLAATGPVLDNPTTYSATIDLCLLWESVQPIASESEGVMEYVLTGRLAYDATWANSIGMTLVNSLATMP